MAKQKDVQFCPKCGSVNIRDSELLPIGDPLIKTAFYGWDCLDCGYTGKDFFIVSEKEHKKIQQSFFYIATIFF